MREEGKKELGQSEDLWVVLSIAAFVLIIAIFTFVPVVYGKFFSVSSTGYGYNCSGGYGYGNDCEEGEEDDNPAEECTAPKPKKLRVMVKQKKKKYVLKWRKTNFSGDCTLSHYKMQLKTPSGKKVKRFVSLQENKKPIKFRALEKNKRYKWRVKAVSDTNSETAWSKYDRFHTIPSKVFFLMIRQPPRSTLKISWKNIVRSRQLKKYRVQLKNGSKIMRLKNVRRGRRAIRTGVTFQGLAPNTEYRVRVRAVFNSRVRSKWSSKAVYTTP